MRVSAISVMFLTVFATMVVVLTAAILINAVVNGNYAALSRGTSPAAMVANAGVAAYHLMLAFGALLILLIALAPLIDFVRRSRRRP